MSSRHLVIAASIVGIVALAGYAYVANRDSSLLTWPGGAAAENNVAAESAPAPNLVGVESVIVEAETMIDDVTAVGTLRSSESVILRPEIAGRISLIRFREGVAVTRGEVMVQLDAAVQQAELEQAKANHALAKSNFQRVSNLFDRKFVSGSARDEAASQLEVARAGVALAEARFERTRLRAPFAGVVGIRNVSVGDYVKEGADLVNLEAISTLKVDFRLPDAYIDRIRPGQTLDVTSDALPEKRFGATVDAIDPLVDAQGRAVLLRARLDNAGNVLRPGMFVRVRLILAERKSVPVVPEEAVVPTGKGQFVFVIEEGKARRAEVTLGVRRGTRVEVLDGVVAGDRVVTAGQLKLRDGASVRLAGVADAAPVAGN
jgi:membrane fusion protein (multidrug efflux system)